MTGSTRTLAAVGVNAADAGVRPGGWIDFAVFVDFNNRAVTIETAGFAFIIRIHAFVQPGIEFPHDFDGVGMFGFTVLGRFVWVAAGAVLGCYDGGDGHLVFFFTPGQV